MPSIVENYDSSALAVAKTHWLFGEWAAISAIDFAQLECHPDRDRLALLVAAAQHQSGDADAAAKYVRLAIQWGCNPYLVARVLIAGVHNTLGRATALAGLDDRASAHFKSAVAVMDDGHDSVEFLAHARSMRELTKLGLLPQAAALMDQSLADAASKVHRPSQVEARLKVLEAQVELLRGGLNLAIERSQLQPSIGRSEIAKEATSQLGQELWVLEKTRYKRGGYFVEFGASDGVLLSNTWLLERRFGWTGICAEPDPRFFSQLRRNRTCVVSDACIASQSGKVTEFILADEYGGMTDFASSDSHAAKRMAYRSLGKTMEVTTTSLADLLRTQGAPHRIDYLSIDTEGSEYDILSGFPFNEWHIRCITVEHNFSDQREAIRELLEPLGYRRQEVQWDDWYYLEDDD